MEIEHWELSIGQIVCFLIRGRICEKLYSGCALQCVLATLFGTDAPLGCEAGLLKKRLVHSAPSNSSSWEGAHYIPEWPIGMDFE
jgi:hypothetical protein